MYALSLVLFLTAFDISSTPKYFDGTFIFLLIFMFIGSMGAFFPISEDRDCHNSIHQVVCFSPSWLFFYSQFTHQADIEYDTCFRVRFFCQNPYRPFSLTIAFVIIAGFQLPKDILGTNTLSMQQPVVWTRLRPGLSYYSWPVQPCRVCFKPMPKSWAESYSGGSATGT